MVLLSSDYPQPPHHYPFLEVQADFDFQGRFIKNDNAMAPHFPKDWDCFKYWFLLVHVVVKKYIYAGSCGAIAETM